MEHRLLFRTCATFPFSLAPGVFVFHQSILREVMSYGRVVSPTCLYVPSTQLPVLNKGITPFSVVTSVTLYSSYPFEAFT